MYTKEDDIGWVHGDFQYEKQLIVFPSEASDGGYQCYYCASKFGKRWDVLRTHIKKYHEEVCDEEISNTHNRISKIAIRCKICHVPQIKTGSKLKKHEENCVDTRHIEQDKSQNTVEEYRENLNQGMEQDVMPLRPMYDGVARGNSPVPSKRPQEAPVCLSGVCRSSPPKDLSQHPP